MSRHSVTKIKLDQIRMIVFLLTSSRMVSYVLWFVQLNQTVFMQFIVE